MSWTHAASAVVPKVPQPIVETDAHEGPVYAADENALYFTTVRRDRVSIKRLALGDLSISLVREDANMANGMAMAPDGRLVVCEQGTMNEPARIALVNRRTGEAETVVEATTEGLPLNSPNDVVVARDGAIWFTDPSYGWLQGFRPEPRVPDRVYRFDRVTGKLGVVAESLDKPNGLAFSPDEGVLYLGDNGAPHQLLAFDVDGGGLTGGRVLAVSTPEHPDGIKVDAAGRIYASFAGGIRVYAPDGRPIGDIELPGAVNFAFGGPGLLVTADDSVWGVALAV